MNKLTKKLIAALMLISTAVSSMAVETKASARTFPAQAPLTAPTVLAKKVTLNSADLSKYQQLATQSQGLATTQVAGASDTSKKVLIVVGVVVVVLGVAALVASNQPIY